MSVTIEPGSFLRRYQAGEHEAVWADMTALGATVRSAPYMDDAWAVARETMRRARSNVETLIRRLDALGYQFWNGEQGRLAQKDMLVSIGGRTVAFDSPLAMARAALSIDTSRVPGGMGRHAAEIQQRLAGLMEPFQAMQVAANQRQQARLREQAEITDHLQDKNVFAPSDEKEIAFIRGLESKGMVLPLSLRAWIEELGDVNLAGAHPALSFWEGPAFPGIYADPLMVTLDHFHFEIEAWEEEIDAGDEPGSLAPVISLDPKLKARLAVADDQLDEGYTIEVPNLAADGPLGDSGRGASFVEYLRTAFRWGGFPGWAQQANPPQELRLLADGLLPI
jgi:hypothetical protein